MSEEQREYLIGQRVRWDVAFLIDATNEPIDPGTVVFKVKKPGAAWETLAHTTPEIGLYRVDVVPQVAGFWKLHAQASGGIDVVETTSFVVQGVIE